MAEPTPETPAVPPDPLDRAVWDSPSEGLLVPNGDTGRGYYRLHAAPSHTGQKVAELPADAVRLVPEAEVQFVLDESERMLSQHSADVAEIERLRQLPSCDPSSTYARIAAGAVPDTGRPAADEDKLATALIAAGFDPPPYVGEVWIDDSTSFDGAVSATTTITALGKTISGWQARVTRREFDTAGRLIYRGHGVLYVKHLVSGRDPFRYRRAAAVPSPDTARPADDSGEAAAARALARHLATISEVLGLPEDAEAADVVSRVRALFTGEAPSDGWASLPTPQDVAAEMSRRQAGPDTAARRESLVTTACYALDAIGTLREKGQFR